MHDTKKQQSQDSRDLFWRTLFYRKYKELKTHLIWRIQVWKNSGLAKAANGLLNKIALAPEREGVEDFVRTITGEGWLSLWDTPMLLLKKLKKAVDAGASVWVHAYNGMRGLTHRELGMVGAQSCLILQQSWFVMAITLIL